MNHRIVIAGVVFFGMSVSSVASAADESPPEPIDVAPASKTTPPVGYTVESGIATTYVARGIAQYATHTQPGLMSAAFLKLNNVGPGSVIVGATNETALVNYSGQRGSQLQIDPSASYKFNLGRVSTETGYVVRFFPEQKVVDGMHEAFGVVSIGGLAVTPSAGVYAELVRMKGAYAFIALAKTIPVGPISLTPRVLSAVAGYEGAPLYLREVTADVSAKWSFAKPFYFGIRGSSSYTGVRASSLSAGSDNFLGRTTPVAMLTFGAEQ